jgi:hypothetical protein
MIRIPIQVTQEGVLIPLEYLSDARDFDLELSDQYLLVRPRLPGARVAEADGPRYSWIGAGRSGNPHASAEVETVLDREIDRRSGWALKG